MTAPYRPTYPPQLNSAIELARLWAFREFQRISEQLTIALALGGGTPTPTPTPDGLAPAGGAAGTVLKKNTATDFDYAWLPDLTGGSGGGIEEAPLDGQDYWRNNGAWTVGGWGALDGKPGVFPPSTHTHPWGDLTGVPATFPPDPHTQDWSTITGAPATFPPSAHTHAGLLPVGGTSGQMLVKSSATDYASAWGTVVSQVEVYGGAALNSVAIVNADVGNTPIYNWRHGGLTRTQMRLDLATGDFQMRINNAAGGASRHAITTFYGGAVALHFLDSVLDNVKLATTATGISVTGEVAAATGVFSGALSAASGTFAGPLLAKSVASDRRGDGSTAVVLVYADPGQNTTIQGLDGPGAIPRWQILRVGSADEVRITLLDAAGINGRNAFVAKYGAQVSLKYDNTDRFNTTASGSNTAGVHTQSPQFVNNVAEGSTTQISDNARTFIANTNAARTAVTFAFPLVPVDKQDLTITGGAFALASVTLTEGGATTILAKITSLPAGAFASWHYRAATLTWYRTG